jgi:hypothetical protein
VDRARLLAAVLERLEAHYDRWTRGGYLTATEGGASS